MGGQEVIMGTPAGRGSPVIMVYTLLGLGFVALLLVREVAHAREPTVWPFLALLGSPLAGLAALAIGFRRHFGLSLALLAGSGAYVAPIVYLCLLNPLTPGAGQSEMAVGFLLLGFAGLAWVIIPVVGFIGWHILRRAQRTRTLLELWLARPPQKRSSDDVFVFYGELERDRPELLRWRGGDKYDELRADLGLDEADHSGPHEERTAPR
jgi:hypothetical protein